jgi:hypothetical protein
LGRHGQLRVNFRTTAGRSLRPTYCAA